MKTILTLFIALVGIPGAASAGGWHRSPTDQAAFAASRVTTQRNQALYQLCPCQLVTAVEWQRFATNAWVHAEYDRYRVVSEEALEDEARLPAGPPLVPAAPPPNLAPLPDLP